MATNFSPDFPSLSELSDLVTFTLDTIKDAVKRLSKGGVSKDHQVLASLPTQLPMLPILMHLEAVQQETIVYYNKSPQDSIAPQERIPDALGLRDRQLIVQAIDLFVIFELYPRLAPGVGIPLDKRVKSEAVSQVLQALQQRSLFSQVNQEGGVWAPSKDTDLEQIVLRLTDIVARRIRGDVASVLVEKNVPDLLPALLQLAYAPLPPMHDGERKPVFWMHEKHMVVAQGERRIELRKRFTRLFDSSSPFVLLEVLTSLLNASLGTRSKWFRTLCGRFLSRVLMRPQGVYVSVEFIAGNDDELNTEKLERIANLLLTPPAGMDRSEYYAKVVPQITAMAVPADSSDTGEFENEDAKQMVDYIMDKAASQERLVQAAVYALQRLADKDPKAFVEYAADPLLLPIRRWFDERLEKPDQQLDDPISRGLGSFKLTKPNHPVKIQVIEDAASLPPTSTSTPPVVSSATALQKALAGIQQLVLVHGSPSEPQLLLEKLVVPVFAPLVHWYAYESTTQQQIKTADDRLSVAEILREIVVTTLASMPHGASVAMVIELVQHVRDSASGGFAEDSSDSMDWPVFDRTGSNTKANTRLVWRSCLASPSEQDQSHVPVDGLLDILADSRLSGLVGDLFVTLLREQEALMELVRGASGDASSSSNVSGIRGLTHKWWLVSQTTMSIIERFGPSVLSRHTDVLAFILNVLDRYMDDAVSGSGEEKSGGNKEPLESLESLMQTLDVDESDTDSKVGGTEIVMLALMLLGQLMSASEEKTFAKGDMDLFDAPSLKLLRTIQGQIKQISKDGRIVRAVAQIASAVQMQVTLVLALQGANANEADPQSEEPSTDVSRFNAALRDVHDELVPVQAHGIIELRSMVLAKSGAVVDSKERLGAVIDVFVDKIKSADSFVYLNAVRGLSALADAHGQRFVPRLIEMYCANGGEFSLDEQLRVGEALLQSIQRAGEMLPEYAPLLVPQLLAMVQNAAGAGKSESEEAVVRVHSALSILATAAETSALALNRWMDLIAATVDGILIAEPDAVELRRAAIVFWVSLLRGFGARLVEMVDMDILRQMHRTLRRISDSDTEDELTQMHAQVGIEELGDVVKSHLFLP
ncbi:hypothetical protein EV178_005635 [Coemansia sp. RSA 1646]|nr:hypothetical protein EV178_005635 [Coemansia sp. RSA 1646]